MNNRYSIPLILFHRFHKYWLSISYKSISKVRLLIFSSKSVALPSVPNIFFSSRLRWLDNAEFPMFNKAQISEGAKFNFINKQILNSFIESVYPVELRDSTKAGWYILNNLRRSCSSCSVATSPFIPFFFTLLIHSTHHPCIFSFLLILIPQHFLWSDLLVIILL